MKEWIISNIITISLLFTTMFFLFLFLLYYNKFRKIKSENKSVKLDKEKLEQESKDLAQKINIMQQQISSFSRSDSQSQDKMHEKKDSYDISEEFLAYYMAECTRLGAEIKNLQLSLSERNSDIEIRKAVYNQPDRIFKCSDSIMSPNESRAYFHMRKYIENINDFIRFKYINAYKESGFPYKLYFIFPQVNISSFVRVKNNAYSIIQSDCAQSIDKIKKDVAKTYRAKSVDYLICKQVKSTNGANWYTYKPIMGIELNGNSHSQKIYGTTEKEKAINLRSQQYRDKEKKSIFEALNIYLYSCDIQNNNVVNQNEIQNMIYEIRCKIASDLGISPNKLPEK